MSPLTSSPYLLSRLEEAQRGDRSPELPGSWNQVGAPVGQWEYSWRAFFGFAGGKARRRGESPQYESTEVGHRGYADRFIAESSVKKLGELKEETVVVLWGDHG